jgi:hypothetical protein
MKITAAFIIVWLVLGGLFDLWRQLSGQMTVTELVWTMRGYYPITVRVGLTGILGFLWYHLVIE